MPADLPGIELQAQHVDVKPFSRCEIVDVQAGFENTLQGVHHQFCWHELPLFPITAADRLPRHNRWTTEVLGWTFP